MVRVVCLAAAFAIAAVMDGVGAVAGDREDARAQEWFWSFPSSGPKEQKKQKKQEQGPEWFWSLGAADRKKRDRARTQLLFFSGVDLWRHAAFAHDGLVWTPAGAGVDGFALKAIVSDGYYQYRAGALGNAQVTGWMAGAAVMPGAHFKRHGVSVAVYAGIDVQLHRLSLFDPGNDLQGRHVGARAAIDLWAEPTPRSMLALSATWSTVGGSYAARVAAGWRLFDWFYFGPEASAFGGPDYRQLRLGMHVTALKTDIFDWRFEWQGGIGYVVDDDGNHGPYARLGILWRH